MPRKGLALPIEMIVIVAIAVLVLVVIAAFFVGGVGRLGAVGDGAAFGTGCDRIRLQGCTANPNGVTVENYMEPRKAANDVSSAEGSLMRACYNLNRILPPAISPDPDDVQCRRACGCPG